MGEVIHFRPPEPRSEDSIISASTSATIIDLLQSCLPRKSRYDAAQQEIALSLSGTTVPDPQEE